MSRVKVNNITPFAGQNITLGGHAIPSGSDKNLGSSTNPWAELYVSTGSVNFVGVVTLGQPSQILATLRAGGQNNTAGVSPGQIFTETNNNLRGSFSVGRNNIASGTASLANGLYNTASGNYSHAEGYYAKALGDYSHAESFDTRASGQFSHAEGNSTRASGDSSHAEGLLSIASGSYSHAEGNNNIALGASSHAEGQLNQALGAASHAEGSQTLAIGIASHAEGVFSTSSGNYSHAEGQNTQAKGDSSHAEGFYTIASGSYSHAEGMNTVALGNASYAGGWNTVATTQAQMVVGQYNALNNFTSLFVVGAGTSNDRKDGFSVEVSGDRPHIVLPINNANPSSPKTGSMYFNPNSNLMFIYNGTTWRSASFA